MPKAPPARARLPRGTKPVIQAFFDALDAIPDASRAEVAKAAHAGIRDALKAEQEQAKQERAGERSAGARVRKARKAKPAEAGRGRGKRAADTPKRASKTAAGLAKRRARTTARTRDNEPFEERGAEQSGDDSELSAAESV
jgi:hypothetical protein